MLYIAKINDVGIVNLASAVIEKAREDYIVAFIMTQQYGSVGAHRSTMSGIGMFLSGGCPFTPIQCLAQSSDDVLVAWQKQAKKIMEKEHVADGTEHRFISVEDILTALETA